MHRLYLRCLGIVLLLLVTILMLSLVGGTIAEAGELKPGTPNTITLPNGEVVYDLNGEWPGIFEIAGMLKDDEIVKITQKGNKFVGIKLLGTSFLGGKNEKTIKGVLEKDQLKNIYFYKMHDKSWTPFEGHISENSNKIVLSGETEDWGSIKISLSRK